MTFIVRATIDARGRLRGVVHHAQTGRKERFDGAARLVELVSAMAGRHGNARTGFARLEESKS